MRMKEVPIFIKIYKSKSDMCYGSISIKESQSTIIKCYDPDKKEYYNLMRKEVSNITIIPNLHFLSEEEFFQESLVWDNNKLSIELARDALQCMEVLFNSFDFDSVVIEDCIIYELDT